MKTSKVLSVAPSLDQNNIQRSWGNPEQGINYDYLIKMEDGVEGVYSSKKEGTQDKFITGQNADYDYTPNSNAEYLGKIKPAKKDYNGGKSFGSDPETRKSIERQTALKAAVEFNRERTAKTFDEVLVDSQKAIDWLQKPNG